MANKLLFLALIFGFISPFPALAANITVNPGESIQTKCANVVNPGDTCTVNAGTYNETVTVSRSGTLGNLIKFIANGEALIRGFNLNGNYLELNGFTVTPQGTCQTNWNGAIQSSGSNNIITKNTVKDSIITGLRLTPTTNSNTVAGNTIVRTNVNGMAINGANHLIENNDISDIRNIINGCNWWNDTNAINFFGPGSVYRKNYIHNMIWENQSGNPHVDAFQTHSAGSIPASNTVIEQNRIFMGNDATGQIEDVVTDLQGFHAFMIAGSNNIVIRNNIIESRHGQNIGGSGGVSNLKIYHNIWRGDINSTAAWPTGANISGVSGYEIFNNIFIDFKYSHITVKNGSTGGSTDNNIFWNSDGTMPGFEGYTIQSGDKRGVDPKFISNFSDYHLQSSSPAINTGSALSDVTTDYDGVSRPQGAGYDIGAFEYSGSQTPPSPSASTVKPGDADNNGKVDGVDYVVWLNHFGQSVSGPTNGDFNNSGKVDGVDYVVWLNNYEK